MTVLYDIAEITWKSLNLSWNFTKLKLKRGRRTLLLPVLLHKKNLLKRYSLKKKAPNSCISSKKGKCVTSNPGNESECASKLLLLALVHLLCFSTLSGDFAPGTRLNKTAIGISPLFWGCLVSGSALDTGENPGTALTKNIKLCMSSLSFIFLAAAWPYSWWDHSLPC